jgi:hypothetical protein
MGSSRRIEKCPQSGWGCMGGGATDHHLEGNHYPVQLYANITPKTSANFASLNSSIARGALRSRRCLRGRPSQAPAESQASKRNTRIKRRKIREDFWGYFDGRSDMKRACFPRPGTSTVRSINTKNRRFSTFFSSKNDFSTVCKYENHCTSPSCFGTRSRK